ncbi:MAG: hypothetical protein U0230_16295 [Polyangiales bacterium]
MTIVRNVAILAALIALGAATVRADEPSVAGTAGMPVVSAPLPAASSPEPEEARPLTAIPLEVGLPVVVRAALAYVDVTAVDENEETFDGTVDARMVWLDPRLRYDPSEAPRGYREYRGPEAVAKLDTLWSPDVALANLRGEPERQDLGLRIFPDGSVELLQRTTGTFAVSMDVERFPFDRQSLTVELVSRRENEDQMVFDYQQPDLDFSRVDPSIEIPGWSIALVDLVRVPLAGWHGETYSRIRFELDIDRDAAETIPSLFVPLFASLLIPLLATWLNKMDEGEFRIEAFELTNIVIGGLFAVIALNFTINAERSLLAHGTNTVARLFGLNYLTLALSFGVNVALFRFGAVRRFFGRHVQEEVFHYVSWALPVLVASSAIALVLLARV